MICGMALTLTSVAHAQRPVGTEVGMHLKQYAPFLVANITRQKNVNFLHLSQVIVGEGNNAVVTAGVNQANNTQPSPTVYFPAPGGTMDPKFKQINVNDQYINQTIVGNGNNAVAQVDVNQSNTGTYTPGQTRWLLLPATGVDDVQAVNSQVNINNTHLEQVAVGNNNNLLAVVNTNQANNLSLPGSPTAPGSLANIAVNINTNVIVQTVVGDGNNAVAQVNVNQQNGP